MLRPLRHSHDFLNQPIAAGADYVAARALYASESYAEARDLLAEHVYKNQGVRLMFDDGARVIFRLSGTGTDGATLRVYLERFVADPAQQDMPVQHALSELAALAEQVASIRSCTGMDAPSVVT